MKKNISRNSKAQKPPELHPERSPASQQNSLQKIETAGTQLSTAEQSSAQLAKIFAGGCGLRDEKLAALIVDQVRRIQGSCEGEASLEIALTTVLEMEPKNLVEAQLAVQMIGVHNAALRSLQKATLQQQCGVASADSTFATASRLMRLFNEQVEAMAKLKGKTGHQRVVVEHVHVHDGGQAIVGAVNTTGSKRGEGGSGEK